LLALEAFLFFSLVDSFQGVQSIARRQGWAELGAELARYRNLTDGVVIQLWGSLAVVLLFATPLLSMRLFAEERHQGTFELLQAAPVTSLELVVGKYLGGVAMVWVPLLISLLFPALLSFFGKGESGPAVEWVTVLLGMGGLLLWSTTCMALGLCFSALTQSAALAGLATAAVLFPWMLLGNLGQSPEPRLRALAAALSVEGHIQPLFQGIFEIRGLIFFASFSLLFVFFAHRALEARREG
jgi:ABC-2 type transport system permease protein